MAGGTMRQRTGNSPYGYGSARLRHGTHKLWFQALFKSMAHQIQPKGAITNLIGRLLGLMAELSLSDVAVSDGPDTQFNISTWNLVRPIR